MLSEKAKKEIEKLEEQINLAKLNEKLLRQGLDKANPSWMKAIWKDIHSCQNRVWELEKK